MLLSTSLTGHVVAVLPNGSLVRYFARKIRFHDPEKAYLAGLLHDLGTMVNSLLLPEKFRAAAEMALTDKIPLCQAEKAKLGFTHCETGRMLAEHWKLPEEFRQVILHHHDVEQAKLYPVLVALVSLSNLFCHSRGLGYGPYEAREVDFLDNPAWLILTTEYPYLRRFDLARFTFEMDEFTAEVRKMTASLFQSN